MGSLTVTEVTSELEEEEYLQLLLTSSSCNEKGQDCQASSSCQTLSRHISTKEKDTSVTQSVGKPVERFSNSNDTVSCHIKDQLPECNADSNLSGNSIVEKDLISETDRCNIRRINKNVNPRRSISYNAEQDRQKMHHSQSFSGEVLTRNNAPTKNKNAVLRRSKSSLDTCKEKDKGMHKSLPQQGNVFCNFVEANVPSQTDNENDNQSGKILTDSRRTEDVKHEENSELHSGFSLSDNQEYQAEAGLAFPNASSMSIVNECQIDKVSTFPGATSASFVNEWQTDEGSTLPNMTSISIENSAKSEEFVSTCSYSNLTLPSEIGCADSLEGHAACKKRDFVLLFPTGDQDEAQCYADHLKKNIGTHDFHDLTVDLFSDIDSGKTAIQSAETLHDRYIYILILVTTNLLDDRLSRFIHEALLLNGLTEAGGKENRVIPVWTREECKQQVFALKHIKGFEYYRFLSVSSTFAAKSYINCVKRAVKRGRENFQ